MFDIGNTINEESYQISRVKNLAAPGALPYRPPIKILEIVLTTLNFLPMVCNPPALPPHKTIDPPPPTPDIFDTLLNH